MYQHNNPKLAKP